LTEDDAIKSIVEALSSLNVRGLEDAVKKAIDAEIPSQKIMQEGIGKGVEEVGAKYERGEYFLSELVFAGHMLKDAINLLKPVAGDKQIATSGKIVIGTIEGDLHDIGKNLVAYMLSGAGFEVHDLGVDVSATDFAEAAKKLKPDVIGVSALLTTTMMKVGSVIEELEKCGLRGKVKVIVGGRPLTQGYADEIGADGYAKDAIEAVVKVKELIKT